MGGIAAMAAECLYFTVIFTTFLTNTLFNLCHNLLLIIFILCYSQKTSITSGANEFSESAPQINSPKGANPDFEISFLEKLGLWIGGNIGFHGLAKPINAFSQVTHVSQAFFIFQHLSFVEAIAHIPVG